MGNGGEYNIDQAQEVTKPEAEQKKEAAMSEEVKVEGIFIASLKRNNKQIRDDRAQAIGEDAQLIYKRKIEDMRVNIRKMARDRENMLDLSPENAMSLKLASDFNAEEYATKDIELGRKIRDAEITLEITEAQYTKLFGGKA